MSHQATFGKRGANLQNSSKALPPKAVAQTSSSASFSSSTLDIGGSWALPSNAYPQISASISSADETDMMRFIGANWPAYRDLWQEMKGDPTLRVNFSFAAFFMSSTWLLYRKQYALSFVIIAIQFALIFVSPRLAWLANLSVPVALGLYGKSIVVKRAISTVDRIKDMGMSPDMTAMRIEKAGGTSWVGPICLGFATFLGFLVVIGATAHKIAELKTTPPKSSGYSATQQRKI